MAKNKQIFQIIPKIRFFQLFGLYAHIHILKINDRLELKRLTTCMKLK